MQGYVAIVIMLNVLVNFLLLLGAARMCGYPPDLRRTVLGAVTAGVYAGACLLPGFSFLGNGPWRIVFLLLISWLSFGFSVFALRRCALFMLLHMALNGITLGLDKGGIIILPAAAIGILAICFIGTAGRNGETVYVPVELHYRDKKLCLTALADTGNTLKDPLTGSPVMVVGSEVASALLGLTAHQLQNPAQSIIAAGIPGLRLIPYKTVGQPSGMLLALRFQNVKIGSRQGSTLVAFAPEPLSGEGRFQALTGGFV